MDTGCNARVNLSDVCEGSPPMLFSLPRQAARCTLQGIKLVNWHVCIHTYSTCGFVCTCNYVYVYNIYIYIHLYHGL